MSIGEIVEKDIFGPQVELCPELASHCCYIDGLGLCIKHPLYFSIPHFPQLNGLANKGLAWKKQALVDYRAAKEWGGFIAAHEKPYRFEALAEIEDELSREQFWNLFADVYIGCENWYEEPKDGFFHAACGNQIVISTLGPCRIITATRRDEPG